MSNSGRRIFLRNTAALYTVQIAEYVLPMLTVPYLARVLQPDQWGAVLYTQGFAAWLGLLLEYGFTLSATRAIAQAHDDPARRVEIVAGVAGGTGLLLVIAALLTLVSAFALPLFRGRPDWLLMGFGLAIVQGVRPFWYFQGREDLHWVAALNLISRVLFTGGVFLVVRDQADAWLVLVLQTATGVAVLIAAAWRMYREVPFRAPTWRSAVATLREGSSMFVLRAAISLYTLANTVILGIFASAREVTFFGGPERLSRAAAGLLQPISQSLYPRMSRWAADDPRRAVRVTWLSLFALGGVGLSGGALTFVLAPWLVRLLLGPGYEPAVGVLRILALLLPCLAFSNVLGVQWMIPRGLGHLVNRVLISAGLLDLVLACGLAPGYGARGMAWAVVAAEFWVVAGLVVTLQWTGAGFWQAAALDNRQGAK